MSARPRRIAEVWEPDTPYAAWIEAELSKHAPELAEYADHPIRWQWWRGRLYLAGFTSQAAAVSYGQRQGWAA